MVDLSIIILSYNTSDLTIDCIRSLFRHYEKEIENEIVEIVVVDNASTDGSPSEISNLKSQISKLELIESKENLGFAKGSNLGAKNAKGDYLLFLNSDTRVEDKGFLQMVRFLEEHKNIGILGAKLKNADGSAQPSAGKFYTSFNLFLMLIGFERFGLLRFSPDTIQKVDWVSGACMMVKREVFNILNGFDEDFFMYMEDMEFCFRARRKGFLAYFYPRACVVHEEHASSDRSFAVSQIYKGILSFYRKHGSLLSFAFARFLLEAKAVILIVLGKLMHSNYLINAYEKSLSYCRE